MARRWLVKTDPTSFSFEDFLEDGVVVWGGVRQPLSRAHLRAMRRGDDVLVYHRGVQRAVVGTARVVRGAYPEVSSTREGGGKPLHVVDLAPVAPLRRPVRLAELRREPSLADWELVRIPRIHVLPVPAAAWRRVLALARRA